MSYKFSRSLRQGDIGETLFFAAHPGQLIKQPAPLPDFKVVGLENTLIELKSDQWDMNRTPNLFMERWSSPGKPGGPWRSLEEEVKFYCYFFPKNLTYFRFETPVLVAHLEANLANYQSRNIENVSHTTTGYLVPRASLEGIAQKVMLTVSTEGGSIDWK